MTSRGALALHPVHAVLLASILPLFLGSLFADIAYARSYQVQWTNFASWLNAGGLVFCALALVWAAIDVLRADSGLQRRAILYPLLLLATFIIGFVNALVHAKDAWAAMPEGLILSLIVAILAVAAIVAAFAARPKGHFE